MEEPPSPSLSQPGQPSISRWVRLSPLGSGSFGHVFLALNLHNHSFFAVKSAHTDSSTSSSDFLALHNELQILQSLHSPSIIQCLGADLSTDGSLQNLFLEYMDGGNLAEAVRQSGGNFQDEMVVRHYTRLILKGLVYLHDNGIVHCDIKCQNILTGSSGVKIADFGSAHRVGDASSSRGNLKGTPFWMAPEVAQGAEPTPSSDIWSLGCTVVEMLQGRPPWAGHVENLAAALFKVGCSEECPPLPESISAEAKEFLLNCLHRDPEARWQAGELLRHPFLGNVDAVDDTRKCEQASPRSALDFLHSDSESDWEEDYSAPTPYFSPIPACTRPAEVCEPVASMCKWQAPTRISPVRKWITVKQVDGWSEERQVPFMQGEAGGKVLQFRRGREVSLASAQFLRNRGAQYMLEKFSTVFLV